MAEVEKDIIKTPVDAKSAKLMSNGKFTIQDYALSFIYGMGKSQRDRFKQMLKNGIKCGESIANNYGVNYDQLMTEVKRILEVKD